MVAFIPLFWTVNPPFVPGTRADYLRPSLSGPAEDVDAGRFRLHFTRDGRDAPGAVDDDGNGLPDLVDTLGLALVTAEAEYADEGWRTLVGDGGAEGSDQLDVYVRALDVYGTATPWRVEGSWSCFLEIDAEVALSGSVARSVATHELHHCVEFRYTASMEAWLYESAATYEQYSHVLDPVLDVAVGALYYARIGAPERRLSAVDGRFEYAGFLWMKFWSELGGVDRDRLPTLWEDLADAPNGLDGLDAAASGAFGLDLADTFLTHAAWNTFACNADDGGHYVDEVLPCKIDVSSPIVEWDGSEITVAHVQSPYTSAYYALPGTGADVGVACDGAEGLRFATVAVDAGGRGRELARGQGGDTLIVPSVVAGTVRLIVAGTDAPLEATCRVVDVPQPTFASQGCATAPGSGWGFLVALLLCSRARRHSR